MRQWRIVRWITVKNYMPLSAPGSNQQVSTDNSRDCLGKVLRYIAD